MPADYSHLSFAAVQARLWDPLPDLASLRDASKRPPMSYSSLAREGLANGSSAASGWVIDLAYLAARHLRCCFVSAGWRRWSGLPETRPVAGVEPGTWRSSHLVPADPLQTRRTRWRCSMLAGLPSYAAGPFMVGDPSGLAGC